MVGVERGRGGVGGVGRVGWTNVQDNSWRFVFSRLLTAASVPDWPPLSPPISILTSIADSAGWEGGGVGVLFFHTSFIATKQQVKLRDSLLFGISSLSSSSPLLFADPQVLRGLHSYSFPALQAPLQSVPPLGFRSGREGVRGVISGTAVWWANLTPPPPVDSPPGPQDPPPPLPRPCTLYPLHFLFLLSRDAPPNPVL